MAEKTENPAVKEKEITSLVLTRINSFVSAGELKIPSDYSPENALKGAMLLLQEMKDRDGKLILEKCTKNSIAQSLLKMCVEGLSPLKKQGYFIPYGAELQWSRSYQGSIALAKRVGGVVDVVANIIYKKDEFEFEVDIQTGYKRILKHVQKIENIDNAQIIGAYAVVIYKDGRKDLEVMTLTEIQTAWNQGMMKGKSGAHTNFTQEMCKKTVINRACKQPINSSSDFHLTTNEDEDTEKTVDASFQEVKENIENQTAVEDIVFDIIPEANKSAVNAEAGSIEFDI